MVTTILVEIFVVFGFLPAVIGKKIFSSILISEVARRAVTGAVVKTTVSSQCVALMARPTTPLALPVARR